MNITVNGKAVTCIDNCTVSELLFQLNLEPETVVIEKNKELISSTTFPTTTLNDQDVLELLHFVGGG